MKTISKKLLPHSIEVKIPAGMDEDRNTVYEELSVSHVRVTPVRAWNKGAEGYQPADSMELICDNFTTEPSDFIPAIGMKIVFEGRTYTINSVKPCYSTTSLVHHYEANLV